MFSKLLDFSYRRNYLEALIFFIFWGGFYNLAILFYFWSVEKIFNPHELGILAFAIYLLPVLIIFHIYFFYRVAKNRVSLGKFFSLLIIQYIMYTIYSLPLLLFVIPSYLTTLESKPQL